MKHPSNTAGFTLIEIMVVVVILSILAAMIVPKIMDRPDQARAAKAQQDMRAVESALNLYRLDNFSYPTTDEGLGKLLPGAGGANSTNSNAGGYLDEMPVDPWGNDYIYLSPGEHKEIEIYSYGADGEEGGEGVNADIANWQIKN